MGIQDKGAFGGFRNKTGALVGHIVNGQNVITSLTFKIVKTCYTKAVGPTQEIRTRNQSFKLDVSVDRQRLSGTRKETVGHEQGGAVQLAECGDRRFAEL